MVLNSKFEFMGVLINSHKLYIRPLAKNVALKNAYYNAPTHTNIFMNQREEQCI